MLHLDLHFSCTQRLMTPVTSNTQKDSLEDRVCAIFSSVFLIVDASFHLFAATYKGFGWAAFQIACKNPPDYYKEAYSHFVKALRCTSMIPVGSLVGFICPGKFQSKKLQEYLRWQIPTNISETTEDNKTLEKELQSKSEEIERLKLQIGSPNTVISSTVSENNSQSLEDSLVRMASSDSLCAEDIMSVSSDSDVEFVDALENVSGLNKILEKELQSKNEEIERLKSQIGLLNKILSSTTSQHKPLKENLVSAKVASSNSSSSEDIVSLGLEDKSVDAMENTSTLNKTLEKELQSKNEEIEKLKLQKDLLNKILSPIKTLHFYNQILVIQKAFNKSIGDTPTIYEYLSDPVKQKITDSFQNKLKMNFLQFCNQEKPDIDSTSISDIFADLLKEHPLGWLDIKDTSISTVINTLFGFV